MKSGRFAGLVLLLAAGVLGMASLAAFVAMVRALMVPTTLAAIESAFGSLVIALLLMVLARKSWRTGRARLSDKSGDSSLQTGE